MSVDITEVRQYIEVVDGKVSIIEVGIQGPPGSGLNQYVKTVNTRDGDVVLTKADVGLENVNNTSDAAKPISTAQQTALNNKVDKEAGKVLSSNDYTSLEKTKLSGIASGATANSTDAQLRDRSTHTGTQAISTVSGLQSALDLKLSISSVVDNLTSTLTNAPLSANQGRLLKGFIDSINTLLASNDTTLDQLQEIVDFIKINRDTLNNLTISNIAGLQSALDAKVPTSRTVAGKPLSSDILLVKADVGLANVDNTSDVNKPVSSATQTALNAKQPTLVSGNNIKTVNGNTLLGSGDLVIASGTGDMSKSTYDTNNDGVVDNSQLLQGQNSAYHLDRANHSGMQAQSTVTNLIVDLASKVDKTTTATQIYATDANGSPTTLVYSPTGVANGIGTLVTRGTANVITTGTPTANTHAATKLYVDSADATKEPTITPGTTTQYYRGDKTFQTLDKTAVGLPNVDNTSDANKPVSTAQQTALNAKQATLVSGSNIKTVNGASILGSGDLAVAGGSGTTNTFNTRQVDQNPQAGSYGAIAGAINGANTNYTVSNGAYASGSLAVTLNGQPQSQGPDYDWVEVAPGSGTFSFNVAPPTGSIIQATYSKTTTTTTSFVDVTTDQNIDGIKTFLKPSRFTNVTTEPVSPPSGMLAVYSKAISGRSMLKMKSPSGLDTPLQPAIFQNSIWLVSPNTTTSVSAVGGAVTSTGTLSTPAPVAGGYGLTTNFATAATAAATAGSSQAVTILNTTTSGSAADNGGWFMVQRIIFPDTNYTTDPVRTIVGVTSLTMANSVANDNPAGSRAAFVYSTALGTPDTNFMLSTKDNTTETRVSTGMPFTPTHMYDFYLYFRPTGGALEWRIDNLTNGTSVSGSTTSTLPLTTSLLRAGFQLSTVNAVVHNIRMKKMYVETDN